MPYALREFTCIDCGGPARRRLPAGSQARCHPCAIDYSAEIQRQLAAHEGIHYDRWAWAYATAVRRMAKGSPRVGVMRVA